MRILFIEDNARFRRVAIAQFLTAHEVVEAASLEEARRALGNDFDVILLDYDLPDGKGLELMPELQERNLAVRTVAISSLDSQNDLLLAAGAARALGKLRFASITSVLRHSDSL